MTDELYIQPVTRIVGCATEAHKRILTLARAELPEETRDELLKKMIAPDRDVTRAPIEDARLHGAA